MLTKRLPTFFKEEAGVASAHGIYWMVGMLLIAGVALDGANSWRVKSQVRVAVDAAALAAAQHLDDPDTARNKAIDVAALNLPRTLHGTVVGVEDVSFGHYDKATGLFVVDETAPTAVKVDGARSEERGNEIGTYLLGFVDRDSFDLKTFSIASAIPQLAPPEVTLHECSNITIISEGFAEMVGNAELVGDVCMHGDTGAMAGSNNLIAGGPKISAPDVDTISLTTLRYGSDDPEDIKVEADMDTQILPTIAADFVSTWNTLWAMSDGSTYTGDLIPAELSTNGGSWTIKKVDQWWWQVKKNHTIDPNTIYLVNHGMKFQNGVDVHNAAFIVRGTVDLGGSSSTFETNFFFAEEAVDVQGNSTIGDPNFCASGAFDTYLLSPGAIKYRGSAWLEGVVTAAPTMDTTGSLEVDGGLYLEAGNDIKIRGANNMTACTQKLNSHYPIAQPTAVPEDDDTVQVAMKARIVR